MTKLWDLPIRIFHWALATAIVTSWVTAENGWLDVHLVSGYVVLGLLLFRLCWGVFGSETARFRHFPLAPSSVVRHARTLFARSAQPYAGHNPLGALMIVFMLGYFLVQVSLGLMATDDLLTEGPLAAAVPSDVSEWASEVHHEMGELVPWIVGLHVAAVLFYWIWKRQNLVGAMITGRRTDLSPEGALRFASPWLALVIALVAAVGVYALVQWGRSLG